MPSIMIHEKIGYDISKKINIHSYDYYLGLMAPDTPNLHGFAPKEERWMAHQRREKYDEWRESLYRFYQQEKEHYPKDFLIGYYLHVLTDIVYDDFYYLKVREKILKDYSLEESHTVMTNDMSQYSFPEINQIQDLLQTKDSSYDILNVKKEELIEWKNKQIDTFTKERHCQYIDDEVIASLGEQVYQEYVSKIEQ